MLDQGLRDLLNEIGELAGRIGREFDAAPHEAAIATLFDRGRSTFGAVRVLLDTGFAHEAVTLVRSLLVPSRSPGELRGRA
jgi:hypothetical protein